MRDAGRTFSVGSRNDALDIARMRLTPRRLMTLVIVFMAVTIDSAWLEDEEPCLRHALRTRSTQAGQPFVLQLLPESSQPH